MPNNIHQALLDLQQGKMIILCDDAKRENEGDLVLAGCFATPEKINFINKHTCGIICTPVSEAKAAQIGLKKSPSINQPNFETPFSQSIDAMTNISTGVSAQDRATTIATLAQESASEKDFASPGHVFPLIANPLGVFARPGHTEGSVDLMRLAKLPETAVIAEIMLEDGQMAKGAALEAFAQEHQLTTISIGDIIAHKIINTPLLEKSAQARIPVDNIGDFLMEVYHSPLSKQEVITLRRYNTPLASEPLVRMHSSCMTGDIFSSVRCDCGAQLDASMGRIYQEHGLLIYLFQEGRGIGLAEKIKAYALQDDQKLDTVDANLQLGHQADERDYLLGAALLHQLNIASIKLLTNNPDKIAQLEQYQITVKERVAIEISCSTHNQNYLKTKKHKLAHLLEEV